MPDALNGILANRLVEECYKRMAMLTPWYKVAASMRSIVVIDVKLHQSRR
jgi:hypothetical protein